jgi:hypothetical protein
LVQAASGCTIRTWQLNTLKAIKAAAEDQKRRSRPLADLDVVVGRGTLSSVRGTVIGHTYGWLSTILYDPQGGATELASDRHPGLNLGQFGCSGTVHLVSGSQG